METSWVLVERSCMALSNAHLTLEYGTWWTLERS
jgi:hypothetical protein